MKSIGIIAEYNPFTNGHLYHINKIKEKYKDYAFILVMSSHFTQRGTPTIIDKFSRTELSLKLGIDLVIELPFPFSTQSADIFAYGATTILEHLKVEKIVFGSESDNIEDLEIIAKTQIENSDFDNLVKIYSKMGNNYPTAVSNAIYDFTEKRITTPNDLLGISYIKAILKNKYSLKYETIKRENNYHETSTLGSATSIRNALKENIKVDEYIPKEEIQYLTNLHYSDNYFNILKYKIITEDIEKYHTVDEGIGNLLKKVINKATTYDELINLCKTKRYTYNKISRTLNAILCNFTKEKANKFKEIKYIRILGLNRKGSKYLNTIKKDIEIPIISKITREKDEMLDYEIEITKIYDIPFNTNLVKKEFERIIYIGGEND